jgi:1,4-dihydroxy-2-naphthoyl-CoA hydrolase
MRWLGERVGARPALLAFLPDIGGERVDVSELPQAPSEEGRFVGMLGLDVQYGPDGTVSGTLPIRRELQQPYGIVHGGVYSTIVETLANHAAALRAMSDGNIVVGISNTTDFLRATREGVLEAIAEPVHIGRSQHLWQVRIWRQSDGKVVARGQVRLQVLPGDGDVGGAPPDPVSPGPV